MDVVARRVLIVGPPGAGKSTVGRELSLRTGLPHTELDQLMFDSRWVRVATEAFRGRVAELVENADWVVDGNYAGGRDLLWSRAQIVVWLDLPRGVILRRLLWRTLRRIVRREDVGAGRRESLVRLLSPHSILLWAARSYRPLQIEYERATEVYAGRVKIVRLKSVAAQHRWLASTRAATPQEMPKGATSALVCSSSAG